jgi:hypothetical protein
MCGLQVLDGDGQVVATRRLDPVEKLVSGMLLFDGTKTLSCSSTGVVRREAFQALGGFDPKLSMSADWDLLLRMLLESHVAYVDEPLVLYRVHDSNMSRRTVTMEHDMRDAFEKAFRHPALPEALKQRRNEAYGRLYRMLAGSYRDHGELVRAVRALAIGVGHHPRLLVELARHPPGLRASPPTRGT